MTGIYLQDKLIDIRRKSEQYFLFICLSFFDRDLFTQIILNRLLICTRFRNIYVLKCVLRQ